MTVALVGTDDGFQAVGLDMPRMPAGHAMTAIARTDREVWAIADRDTIWRDSGYGEGAPVANSDGYDLHCVLAVGDRLFVGTSQATILEMIGSELVRLDSFHEAPGRDGWYTPWGGPPDVRSMALDAGGAIYVNVHVGGVVRSRDTGHTWEDTMDIDADVQQVIAHPTLPGNAYVAAAAGLGVTTDGAEGWSFETDGLHASYCRAVAVSDEMLFVSASRGPGRVPSRPL